MYARRRRYCHCRKGVEKVCGFGLLSLCSGRRENSSVVRLDLNCDFAAQKRKVIHQRVRARVVRYSDTMRRTPDRQVGDTNSEIRVGIERCASLRRVLRSQELDYSRSTLVTVRRIRSEFEKVHKHAWNAPVHPPRLRWGCEKDTTRSERDAEGNGAGLADLCQEWKCATAASLRGDLQAQRVNQHAPANSNCDRPSRGPSGGSSPSARGRACGCPPPR